MYKDSLDLIIIGAGPIGIACGIEAKKAGLKYLIIEKGTLVNSIFHYPVNMNFFSTSEKLELDDVPFVSKAPKPSKQEALEYYRRLATSNKLKIQLYEKVERVTKNDALFEIITDKNSYTSRNLILATGFYDLAQRLNVPGEDLPHLSHYYDDPHRYIFQKVAIVGASNSAVDAALEIYRKGGEVAMLIREEEISDHVKYWVKPDIENRIKEGSIKAYFNTTVQEIKEDHVVIKTDGEVDKIQAQYILALTGYKPNFKFLRSLGINLQGDSLMPQYDEHTMESNVNGVYLAGVVCGGLETHKWFIENSRIHATKILNAITSNSTSH